MYKLSRLSQLQVVFCTKTKTQINSFYENYSLSIGYMCISLKRLLRYRTISYVWFCSSGTNCVNCKWHAIIFFMVYSLNIWLIYSLKLKNVFARKYYLKAINKISNMSVVSSQILFLSSSTPSDDIIFQWRKKLNVL